MPIEPAQHRVAYVASVSALATMVVGGFVLHRTLRGTSDGSGLSLWSIVLAVIWTAGWLALARVAPRPPHEEPPHVLTGPRTHPLLLTLTVGSVFAVTSLIGALILREIPGVGSDVAVTASRVTDNPMLVFVIALGTGATEESFFRLGLSRLLSRRWFPLVSTIAYGIVTLATGSLALTMAALLLGATSSVTFTATGRWYTPILIHALWTVALVGVFPLL